MGLNLISPRWLLAMVMAALLTSCTARGSSPCPITEPNGRTPPGESPSARHHGNGELFTALWPDGQIGLDELNPAAIDERGWITIKFPWWRGEGIEGPLQLQGDLLSEGEGQFEALIPEGYGLTGFQATGLRFSQPGCWRVIASVGTAELVIVTRLIMR